MKISSQMACSLDEHEVMLEYARQVVGMGDQVAGNVGQIDDQDPNIFPFYFSFHMNTVTW